MSKSKFLSKGKDKKKSKIKILFFKIEFLKNPKTFPVLFLTIVQEICSGILENIAGDLQWYFGKYSWRFAVVFNDSYSGPPKHQTKLIF